MTMHAVREPPIGRRDLPAYPSGHAHDPDRHAMDGMGGLVIGTTVEPRQAAAAPNAWRPARRLRLFVQSDSAPGDSSRRFGYVLQRGAEPARDSIEPANPMLVLTRGQPTQIDVVNRSGEPTAVHWRVTRDTGYAMRLGELQAAAGRPLTWRPVAKDGWPLPAEAAVPGPAIVRVGNGETADVELTPDVPGDARLELMVIDATGQRMAIMGVVPLRFVASPVVPNDNRQPTGTRHDSVRSFGPVAGMAGADSLAGVTWMNVEVPGGGRLRAAVARPTGPGPFPVVVVLHGSHGFAREYVRLARDLARDANVVAVAGCWFTGSAPAGARFVTPIACPDAPPMSAATNADDRWAAARSAVDALVQAARALPGARADDVALVGHSRGAGTALQFAQVLGTTRGLRAIVLNSAGYPDEAVARAPSLSVPVLMIHGTVDAPADGGTAFTAVERARAFESALRTARQDVEAVYVDGGQHNGLFASAAQYDATVRRVGEFLRRHLQR